MRILFITATRIGDAVISTGLLSYLIEKYPGAKVTVACGPLAESLFSKMPGVERVIVLSKSSFSRHWFRLWADVKPQSWDIVVDLRRSLIPYVVKTRERHRLGPDDHKSHRVKLLSDLFGISPPNPPKLYLSASEQAEAVARLKGTGPVIALCPTAAREEKTWPLDSFQSLAQSLVENPGRFEGGRLLLVGAEQDRPILDRLSEAIPSERSVIMAGNPNLRSVAAVLSQCMATIANDSGLAHLAAASGCPTVALFGPTREDLYRPWGMRVAVVQAPEKDGQRPISGISVEEVVAELNSVLD